MGGGGVVCVGRCECSVNCEWWCGNMWTCDVHLVRHVSVGVVFMCGGGGGFW